MRSFLIMRFIACMATRTGEYRLFSWGANSYGQLGSGHKEDTLLPARCLLQPGVDIGQLRQITGGGGHSTLLTDDGQLYVFGWNKSGQLGCPVYDDMTIPQRLLGLPAITKVSCGWNHTLATCDRGTVFAWGSNTFGQLGIPAVQRQSDRPVQLSQQAFCGARVSDIAAGLRHSLAVTDGGMVFSWGDGKKGQLGLGREEMKVQQNPKSLATAASWRCTNVSAGAYHSIAIAGDGTLLSWGLNQHGQCGVGFLTEELRVEAECFKLGETQWVCNVCRPVRVKGLPPIAQVDCGWSHVLAVSVCKEIFTWGRSDYGQLGRGEFQIQSGSHDPDNQSHCCHEPREIPSLKGCKQAVCGSEHNILITGSNLVTTFGWNEHGMCGTGNETNVHSPHTVESLRDFDAVLVGAGAGHCFVVARRHRTGETSPITSCS